MKKVYRLLRNEDFQRIIQKQKKLISKKFILYYDDNHQSHIRVGITVSSRYGGAVLRNKVKRQVRSILQTFMDPKLLLDVVIIIRNGYKTEEYQKNSSDLQTLWNQVKKEKEKL